MKGEMKKVNILLFFQRVLLLLVSLFSFFTISLFPEPEQLDSTDFFLEMIEDKGMSYQLQPLKDFVPVEWDKVYVFRSYIRAEKIYEKIGYRWEGEITDHDDTWAFTLVFMLGDKVVYDIHGPNRSISFYHDETELELNNQTSVLVYPNLDSNFRTFKFAIVPESVVSSIEKKAVVESSMNFGIWKLDFEETGFWGEMVVTREGVGYIRIALKGREPISIWVLNDESIEMADDENIAIIEYSQRYGPKLENVKVRRVMTNGEDITMELSFFDQEENRILLPLKKAERWNP